MNSTALGAKKETISFISEAHEKFYYEKLKEVRYVDVYHKSLCYCLGISDDTRRNINRIYDFKTGCVKPECLHDGWQTSGNSIYYAQVNGKTFEYDHKPERSEVEDDEYGNPTQWSATLSEGVFLWIDKEADGYAIYDTADTNRPALETFSTLQEAMDWGNELAESGREAEAEFSDEREQTEDELDNIDTQAARERLENGEAEQGSHEPPDGSRF